MEFSTSSASADGFSGIEGPRNKTFQAEELDPAVDEIGFSPECIGRASAVYTTLLVIIVGTGVIGNTLALIVLHFQSRPSTFNFLIIVLACVDVTILLLLPVDRLMYREQTPSLALLVIYVYIVDKAAGIARLASVWMLIIIAFFRFMAVCVPLKVKIYCTHKNAKRCVLVLFIVDLLIHLPFYFSQRVQTLPNTTTSLYQSELTEWGNSRGYHLYADVIYTTCFFFALPFLVLIYFSLRMVRTLYGSQREKYFCLPHLKHEASDVTKVVIAIIVAFLVSYTPYMIWTVDSLIPGRRERLSAGDCSLLVYRYTLDLFMYLNSSVNFFIYLVLRKNFRKSMKKLLCCNNKRKHKQQPLEEVTSPNTELTVLKNNCFKEASL